MNKAVVFDEAQEAALDKGFRGALAKAVNSAAFPNLVLSSGSFTASVVKSIFEEILPTRSGLQDAYASRIKVDHNRRNIFFAVHEVSNVSNPMPDLYFLIEMMDFTTHSICSPRR